MAHTEKALKEVNYFGNFRVQWTDAMIKLLLTEININIESAISPVHKQVWKNIAASMNVHGYNVTAENCNIKWTGMKKIYKQIKDASNKTGAAKQTWEYFDIMNNMLRQKPEIAPLSIASSTCGFQINQNALNTSKTVNIETNLSDDENEENEVYELEFGSPNIITNRVVRRRKSKPPTWATEIMEQKERHLTRNYEQRERLLDLLEKNLQK